ncbi:MAG TPA: acyl-CoA dehydrogenase family protein [Paraburkholderia sp.]|jgi:alkylation response protein AidB-like acyl-CoA dehydrogenase|nr:acyl-CoA dehydrogenase family protein [Paraburkholderia sp.]
MNDAYRPARSQVEARAQVPDLTALVDALRASAAARDAAGGHAAQEKQWIAETGVLTLTVPREFGGTGASWFDAYRAVRTVAAVDAALGHLLGFQFLQVASVDLWGSDEQRARYLRATVDERWWWGNAINPLDPRLVASATGDGGYRLDGVKGFCSGTRGSQMMTLSAQDPASGKPVFGVVPTGRAGITVNDDWDPIGQRQTDSGSVSFEAVALAAHEVIHRPDAPRATLRTLVAQMVLTNLFVGIALGALEEARRFFTQNARPWVNSGVDRAVDDPYMIHRFGEMRLKAIGAEAMADRAAHALDEAWQRGGALAAEQRAQVALATSEAKVFAHRASLDVSEALFDACGARATGARLALDRFWRNARVHTLHDPLDYRVRDIGRYALLGTLPEVSLYT